MIKGLGWLYLGAKQGPEYLIRNQNQKISDLGPSGLGQEQNQLVESLLLNLEENHSVEGLLFDTGQKKLAEDLLTGSTHGLGLALHLETPIVFFRRQPLFQLHGQ